jgi:uncharacterized protein
MLVSETTNKPLPEITDQTRPFWTAASEGRLLLQTCTRCGTAHFRPAPWCIQCGCRDIPWKVSKPTGTVYAVTLSRVVAMNLAGWQSELPVIMCLIDLDDGARLYGQVMDCKPDAAKIGMRVAAYFEPIAPGVAIPKFKPA